MKKILKRLICCLLVCTMITGASESVSAAERENVTKTDIVIDGQSYTIEEWYEGDTKIVNVVNGNSSTFVVLNEEELQIYGKDMAVELSIEEVEESIIGVSARTTASNSSLFWGYSYYYSDSSYDRYGMYFKLEAGEDDSWSGFDKHNEDARDIAYDFCTEVRELNSQQAVAVAASGASAASIAAGIASAAPTGGVGAIVGVVAAFLSGGVAVAEWVSAWNTSLNCDQLFLEFTQEI